MPTFTCGFLRSNFALDIDFLSASVPKAPAAISVVRRIATGVRESFKRLDLRLADFEIGAHDRSRTGDLTLTKGVLYQLSYMG